MSRLDNCLTAIVGDKLPIETARKTFFFLLGIAVMLIVIALPSPSPFYKGEEAIPLTANAKIVMAVLCFAVIQWMTEAIPFPATSLCLIVFLHILGVASFDKLVTLGFGNNVLLFLMGAMGLSAAMTSSGLARRFMLWMLTKVGRRTDRIVLAFITAYMLQNVFQSFLIAAEKPKLGLWVTVAAGVTNMALDALFMAVFHWGVAGAAIATGISQIVGGVLPLVYFLRPNSSLLQLTKTKLELRPILQASGNGASELVSNVTASVVGMLYNFQLLRLAGQNGVAAFGVLMYVEFIFAAVFIGYAIGCAPIVSYHFGAGNRGELQNLLRKSILLMGVGGLAMVGVAQGLAGPMARLFVGYDNTLCRMTVHAFRIATLSFVLVGFNIFASSFFTALNDGVVSAIISFLRTFMFKLSAVLLLPLIWELDGIWWAEVAAEICAFGLGMAFLLGKRKKYGYM